MATSHDEEGGVSLKSLFVPLTTLKAIHWIVFIGLVVLSNGLFNGFIGDDQLQIVENPFIHSLQNFFAFFTGSTFFSGGGQKLAGAYYRPLVETSFSIIYTLFGANSFFFHLLPILLCIANACFIFLVFKHFFTKPIAFILALLFLVHPINSEIAYYVSDVQEGLFFLFGIIAFWILLNFQQKKALVFAGASLLLSLFAKETGILFILISFLYIFLSRRKDLYRFLIVAGCSFGFYILLRLSAIDFLAKTIANAPIEKADLTTRLINIPAIFLFYIKTFLFPLDLATAYHWVNTQINFTQFFFPLILGLLFLLSLALFGIFIFRKFSNKYLTIYILFTTWLLLGIAFHLQIIPLDQTVADRWFYFPIVGLLGMVGVFLSLARNELVQKILFTFAIIAITLLSVRTFVRSFDFRDQFTIASHDIKYSQDAYNIEYNLSVAYFQKGQFKEAKTHALRSIKLFPNTGNYTSLGVADFSMGDYKNAKIAFLQALKYGDFYQTYENLAGLSLFYGNPNESIDFIKNVALEKYSQDGSLWLDLAILEYTYSNREDAKTAINNAYALGQNQLLLFTYNTIMHDQPLPIKFKNGQIIY